MRLFTTTAVLAGALFTQSFAEGDEVKEAGAHYVKLGFDKLRGDSYEDATPYARPLARLMKRGDGYEEIVIENQQSFYSADIELGTPGQNVTVLVDTGSSDLWVMGNNNPYCQSSGGSKRAVVGKAQSAGGTIVESSVAYPTSVDSSQATMTCSVYGTYATSSSSSFKSNNTVFEISYGDGSFALGTWGTETITVGNIKVENMSLAVANETNSTVGVLGIGLAGLESTSTGSSSTSKQYDNFPLALKNSGAIKQNAYSLFLDSLDAKSGSVLFGAVDHSKYNGTLYTVPLVNTYGYLGATKPIQFEVTLQGLGISANGTESTFTTTKIPALLDSGTTLAYFPVSLTNAIAKKLGAVYSSRLGYYVASCSALDNDSALVFDFGGFQISSPLENYVIGSQSDICVLGILPQSGNGIILGDEFLTSAYVVYDLDNLEVSMAQANYNGGSEKIEVISGSVPSAQRAPGYSSSWSTYSSISTGGNIFTITSNSSSPQTSGSGSTNSRSTSGSSGSSPSSTTTSTPKKNAAAAFAPSGITVKVVLLSTIMSFAVSFAL
ncbi:LAMI_0H16798g1_1 [Lachancea mirantina]|uniref:LAMI_0H16798g1_1 n=1 Tax=Lachancea mirantina TaxID=1230905 RepID=A0A1G4KIY9_9SACH|nr:LAMI_0H16798g1_1 [Lachancea mirantina]